MSTMGGRGEHRDNSDISLFAAFSNLEQVLLHISRTALTASRSLPTSTSWDCRILALPIITGCIASTVRELETYGMIIGDVENDELLYRVTRGFNKYRVPRASIS